ncbi:uncharacterized protein BXZ73DRAFT_44386 [Epithele typhae]|uniref:uncharacterized protein n=1 Tax=Epithele typhae TaxID=378194 RepID=UPI00200886CB|nr:uncharacterized protein BXZ73DRAFT_44386 [Epithele typhae]KAH9938891.1 hypothetical protein BXZ73DRAFT_44386 [Epithele typhae]
MELSAQSSRVRSAAGLSAPPSLGTSATRRAESAPKSPSASASIAEVEVDSKHSDRPGRKPSFVSEHAAADDWSPANHGFFSSALAARRREYLIIIGRATVLIILLMWSTLPVYWGALSNSSKLVGNLEAWFIDRDGDRIGQGMSDAVSSFASPGPKLNWKFKTPDEVGTDLDVVNAVLDEKVWVVIVVQPNATIHLSRARAVGSTTYDPSKAIRVYYNQARQEIATGNFIVPLTTQILQATTVAYATGSAQRYFAQVNSNGEPNATALQLIANAPQTITPGISWTMINLRPYNAPAAQAATLVGNIFLVIFSYTMANSTCRALVEPYMAFRPYIRLRLVIPLLAYFPLSLSFALMNLAFGLPLGTKFGSGGGFIISFFYIYLGMSALGLSIEAMITLLTPRFAPFFLFTLILYNISPVVLPPELLHPFFSYGLGFPIFNLSHALRTILFNTKDNLGVNAGVLVAWIALSCFTITLFSWIVRRWERRVELRAVRALNGSKGAFDGASVEKGKGKGRAAVDVLDEKAGSKAGSKAASLKSAASKGVDGPST